MPLDERPRERLKKYGVESLSNEEILSILLRSGTKNKSVKEMSRELLNNISIKEFANTNIASLKQIKGMGEVKAMTLICAIEFGKRVFSNKDNIIQIRTSKDVYELVKDELTYALQEKLIAIFLDSHKRVLLTKTMFIGTVNASTVYFRDIFREAVKCNSVGFIIVHNHPTGNINPSYNDVYLTNTCIKIGKIMEIKLIDHLIIGHNSYYSFLENKGDMFE